MIEERNGQRYTWTMPNSSWHSFVFNNVEIEVRVVKTANGRPLITFRNMEYDRIIFQEPIQRSI